MEQTNMTANDEAYARRAAAQERLARAARRRQARNERIRRTRSSMEFILAMAHGVVELTLRREPRRVRQTVRGQLDNRYGFKAPRMSSPLRRL